MYVNNKAVGFLLVLACVVLAHGPALAVPGVDHDVHRVPGNDEFQSTIESRCTICHTRSRVDKAIGEEADIDALLELMIERGAILSERDRKVLGTFGGSPLQDGEPESPDAK